MQYSMNLVFSKMTETKSVAEPTIICTDVIDRSVSFPNVKREVDHSVYILTKREDEDGLYKKDGLYRKAANENGLYEKDGLHQDGCTRKTAFARRRATPTVSTRARRRRR